MNTRGSARAATAAPGQGDFDDDNTDWENPGPGDGEGIQGDGGEGGGDPEDATFDPEFEQDGGEPGEPGEELDGEPARPQRAQNRIQSLANENARLKRDLDDFRTRLDRVAQPTQPAGPMVPRGFETDEQFNARIQLLPPDERMEQRAIRSEQKAEYRAQVAEFKSAQTQDKIAWETSCQTNDRRKRWAPEVERERERLIRENGQYVNRDIIYHWLLGKWMDSPAGEKRSQRQRQSAQQRIRSQETRPTSPRGDVDRSQRGRLNEAQARAKRLEGVNI